MLYGKTESVGKPDCALCGHSYAQHTKGPATAEYCRHCPCAAYTEVVPLDQWAQDGKVFDE